MEIYFILVEPAVPENVGSAARAIKTMGFKHMRIVNSHNHQNERAGWLAHGSGDILQNAEFFPDLAAALADIDLAIGTTANNKRSAHHDYYNEGELLKLVETKKSLAQKVALVFGREESGLHNEELRLCDVASTIPLKTFYPSLNLAQAVLVYAYSLSPLKISRPSVPSTPAENDRLLYVLKTKTGSLLEKLEIEEGTNLYHRIMERMVRAGEEETHLFLSVIKAMEKKGLL